MSLIANRRVLIVVSEFPPQPGGIGNHGWNLARQLHKAGACVRVITEGRKGGRARERVFDGAAPFAIARVPFLFFGLRQICRICVYLGLVYRWKPEVVIASGRVPLFLVAGIPLSAVKVAALHGTEAGATNSVARRSVLLSLERFACLIPVSRFTCARFNLKPDDARVTVIPNGVSSDRFAEATAARGASFAGSPCLVTVGNVTRRKGQDNVIRALPAVLRRYPEAVYHVAGIPTERDAFGALAGQLGVGRHVIFHGEVSDATLAVLLQQADVFLLLSAITESGDVEGFGIAILEANLFGVPAIGASGCGIEDAILDGKSGILVNAADAAAVARAIEAVMRERPEYSRHAIEWAAGHSWGTIGGRYGEVIQGALRKGGKS